MFPEYAWPDYNLEVDISRLLHEIKQVKLRALYEGWNFNSGNYLFTTDTKQIHVSKFYCPSM